MDKERVDKAQELLKQLQEVVQDEADCNKYHYPKSLLLLAKYNLDLAESNIKKYRDREL